MTNRLKGLDLIEGVPEALWMEVHNTVREVVVKTIPKKKKCKKAKRLSEEALQIAEKKKKKKKKKLLKAKEKGKIPIRMQSSNE